MLMCQQKRALISHLSVGPVTWNLDAWGLTALSLREFFLHIPRTKWAMSNVYGRPWKATDWKFKFDTCSSLVSENSGESNFFYCRWCLWNSLHLKSEFWFTTSCERKSWIKFINRKNLLHLTDTFLFCSPSLRFRLKRCELFLKIKSGFKKSPEN